ncbi:glycosyltransferase family 39 protein [bacterium]|nr:glycosyltransferase family 39 protein [bacterium]
MYFESGFQKTKKIFNISDFLMPILVLSILGLGIRFFQFSSWRSLWLDEAMLARNIMDRSLFELLFQPLDYNQGAPILFLFIEKIFTFLFGRNDIALRLFPLICGVLSVPLTVICATKLFGKLSGWIAGFLVAFNIQLIYYSSEVKQYTVDAFIILVVVCCFIDWYNNKFSNRTYWFIFAIGIISTTLSHPALFIFSGLAFVLWVNTYFQSKKEKNFIQFYKLTGVLATWLVLYGIVYFVSLRGIANNNHLTDYWINGFMPIPPWGHFEWFQQVALEFLITFLPWNTKSEITFIILIALGLLSLWSNKKQLALGMIISSIGVFLASALQFYPLAGRLLVFSIPIIAILLGGGIQLISKTLKEILKDIKWASWGFVGVLCLSIGYGTFINVNNLISNPDTRYNEHIKPLLEIIENERKENEVLYVYYPTVHAYRYYQTVFERDDYLVFYGKNHRSEPFKYIEEINELSDYSVVWIIITHDHNNEKQFIQNYLDEVGDQLNEYNAEGGATLWKYQLYSNGE